MTSNYPLRSQIIVDIVHEIWWTIWLEPEFGQAGVITFSSGTKYLYLARNLNPNLAWSIHISRNKGYSHMFLEKFWYGVVEGRTFFSEILSKKYDGKYGYRDALAYAIELWFPVIIKPNSLSQWKWVQKVSDRDQFLAGIDIITPMDDVYRVESFFVGDDYRIVVLDDEIISAYKREPLSVVWDGIHSLGELLFVKQQFFESIGRDTRIDRDDHRIIMRAQEQWYTLMGIPKIWEYIALLDNANLSSGWDATDVTESIHEDYKKLAIDITRDMWLRFCGVDLMLRWSIEGPIGREGDYIIVEVNGSPWLDHYVTTGEKQRQIVKEMYKKILLAIEKELSSEYD